MLVAALTAGEVLVIIGTVLTTIGGMLEKKQDK